MRYSYFGQISLSISSNMNNYTQNICYSQNTRFAHGTGSSPQSIEKSDPRWLFLATIT